MTYTVTVNTAEGSETPAKSAIARARNIGKGRASLVSILPSRTAIYMRDEGPQDSPFAGPTISNGHWLLTRPKGATKAFDALWDKASKLVDAGKLESRPVTSSTFERVLPGDHYKATDIRPDIDVEVSKERGLGTVSNALCTTDKGKRVAFDVKYLAPILNCGLTLKAFDEYSAAIVCDGDAVVGLLMPRRL